MRLIDADALSELVGEPIEIFLSRLDLKLPPTVDAVPVIRCKDCKYLWHEVAEDDDDSVVGYLTAADVVKRVEAWLERRKNEETQTSI